MSDYINQHNTVNSFVNSENWTLLNNIEMSIKKKIECIGTRLSEWELNINRGILTGYNDAFIIDEETKNRLISKEPKSAEIIRPILRGKDIKKYSYNYANIWLISTFPSLHINIDNYPAIKNHLLSFGKERLEQSGKKNINGINGLNARKKTGNKWYETQDQINYWNDFNEQNIAWQRITHENTFCLTKEGMVILDSMAFINGAKEYTYYLLAVLNSKLIKFWIKKNVPEYGSTGFRLSNQFVTIIPVPKDPDSSILKKIDNTITRIINGEDLQSEIDNLVYSIYQLTQTEIDYIEKELS